METSTAKLPSQLRLQGAPLQERYNCPGQQSFHHVSYTAQWPEWLTFKIGIKPTPLGECLGLVQQLLLGKGCTL